MDNVSRGSAGAAGGRFAHVADAFSRMGSDGLASVFSEGDGYATHVLVEDVELAYECANGSTFEGCRFIGCAMDRSWLNRVDMRDCSAPGMSLLQARLAQVSALSTDLSYANLSETLIDRLSLGNCKLREAALQRAKLKRVRWDACDLTRIDVFGTPLAGIDVSGCAFAAPVLSGDFHELRGAVVSVEQALDVARLLGVRIAEE